MHFWPGQTSIVIPIREQFGVAVAKAIFGCTAVRQRSVRPLTCMILFRNPKAPMCLYAAVKRSDCIRPKTPSEHAARVSTWCYPVRWQLSRQSLCVTHQQVNWSLVSRHVMLACVLGRGLPACDMGHLSCHTVWERSRDTLFDLGVSFEWELYLNNLLSIFCSDLRCDVALMRVPPDLTAAARLTSIFSAFLRQCSQIIAESREYEVL